MPPQMKPVCFFCHGEMEILDPMVGIPIGCKAQCVGWLKTVKILEAARKLVAQGNIEFLPHQFSQKQIYMEGQIPIETDNPDIQRLLEASQPKN